MSALRVFLSRLSALLQGQERERDLDDEISGHLGEAVDEYVARGLSAADARAAAMRDFGASRRRSNSTAKCARSHGPRMSDRTCVTAGAACAGLQRLR